MTRNRSLLLVKPLSLEGNWFYNNKALLLKSLDYFLSVLTALQHLVSSQTRLPFSEYSTCLPYPIKCASLLLRNPLSSTESTRPWLTPHFTLDLRIIVSVWLSHLCDQCEWPGIVFLFWLWTPTKYLTHDQPRWCTEQTSTEIQVGAIRQTATAKWGKWAVYSFHFPKEIPMAEGKHSNGMQNAAWILHSLLLKAPAYDTVKPCSISLRSEGHCR